MRIAIDARYLTGKGSGIGTYTYNLARSLLQVAPDLELLLITGKSRPEPWLDDPRVQELHFPFPPNSPATCFALGPFLRRHPFDAFHSPFAVVPQKLHRPLVVTVHDLMWMINPAFISHNSFFRFWVGGFYRLNLEWALASANRILTVSEATRNAIVEHTPWNYSKVRVTFNGLDRTNFFRLTPEEAYQLLDSIVPPGTPFVLTIGNASPHKNHFNAVRGFLKAFGNHPDYRLILVRRFLRQDSALHKLLSTPLAQAKVITLPHVSQPVLNALYNAARIFLHPAYYEGFGIPLLEAMAAGTPVVTSKTSCLPEVAGPAALLVDPADPEAIASALLTLDQQEQMRQQLITEGFKRLENFTWENCARQTYKVYQEICR